MSCCSRRRNVLATTPQLRAATSSPPNAPQLAPGSAATSTARRLRYLRDTPLSLRGPFSGRVYRVDAASRFIDADARDAEPLLRTGLFERVEPG